MHRGTPVSRALLVHQLEDLGVVRGGVLLVHASFRATGPVEGGPAGLIEALREAAGPDGTLVMPSWSGDQDEPFDPAHSASASDLGVVPQTFWHLPGVKRSDHSQAFAAVGPAAEFVLQDGLPLPPHRPESPVGRVHDLDGQVLLLGVNHNADTTIHLAELMAEVPYGLPKYCTVLRDGRPRRVDYLENDHCCRRFLLVDDWLQAAGAQSVGTVGHGSARLVRARVVTDVVVPELQKDPLMFLHPNGTGCGNCDAAHASVGLPRGSGAEA